MPKYSVLGSLGDLVEAITASINEIGSVNLDQGRKGYTIKTTESKPFKAENLKERKADNKEENSQGELIYKKTGEYQIVEEQSNLAIQLNENNIREAFVYSEILGKPKCKRRRRW